MTPANDLEPVARDATAYTELPHPHRRVWHVSPGLALILMSLGVWGALYVMFLGVAALFRWLAGAS